MFEWQELDLTSEILFMPREHKIHIFEHVMFFLSYRHADDAVFDDLPKIFDLFPKNFQNFFFPSFLLNFICKLLISGKLAYLIF